MVRSTTARVKAAQRTGDTRPRAGVRAARSVDGLTADRGGEGGDGAKPLRLNGAVKAPRLLPLVLELFIVEKDGHVSRLGDVIKPAQVDFVRRCQRQLDTRGQIRVCVLKARQIGMSTIIEAIQFVLAMLYENFNVLVVSHEKDSAAWILDMTRRYWDYFIFADLHQERYKAHTRLAWENNSDMHIATAKTMTAGRSTTIRSLHASEVAFWPNASTLMTGLSNSIPSFGLNAIFLESTANGVGNYFHKQCNAAMKGESEYEFFFYPWYQDREYTAAYIPDEVRGQYSRLGKLDDEERTLVKRYGLTEEQLIWRRWAIVNKCEGDVEKFHQEFPTTPHEAFISTGRNVYHLPHLLNHYEPRLGKRGNLMKIGGKIRFVENPRGYLTLFSYPSDDKDWGVYLAGGDPTHTPVGDNACIQVLNRRTLEQVAVYRRKVDPITFGKDMQMIGTYFNHALLAPEKEGPGYATVGCIVADYYPNVYQSQRIDKAQGKPTADLFGWSTNSTSKHVAIQHLVNLFSQPIAHFDRGDWTETYGLVIHDPATLIELRDYVTSEKGLGYENSDGSEYDDGVMALAIAAAVHAIEPKPGAFEEVAPHELRKKLELPIQTGLTSGTARPIDDTPHDEPILSEYDNENPEAPWEAWGEPLYTNSEDN